MRQFVNSSGTQFYVSDFPLEKVLGPFPSIQVIQLGTPKVRFGSPMFRRTFQGFSRDVYPVTTQYPFCLRVSCRPSTKKGGIYLEKPS